MYSKISKAIERNDKASQKFDAAINKLISYMKSRGAQVDRSSRGSLMRILTSVQGATGLVQLGQAAVQLSTIERKQVNELVKLTKLGDIKITELTAAVNVVKGRDKKIILSAIAKLNKEGDKSVKNKKKSDSK